MTAAPEPRGTAVRCRGFGLIEVLVTLAIGAIGLLGEALLLQRCLAAESAALRRAQSTTLLAALAERIRTNAAARADYALPPGAPAPAVPACAASASCTPAEVAADDLARWLEQIAAALPAPAGAAAATIDVSAGPGGSDRVVIDLRWAEPEMTTPASMSLTLLLAGAAP